ncbi:MAG: hypothetical protein AAF518_07495 [Spirochaetota bacterium]
MSSADIACFSASLILLVYFGWRHTRSVQDESAYLLANRKTGLFALVATLVMTEFNPTTLLAFSGPGYYVGLWGLLLPSVFLLGLGFYTVSVSRQWKRFNAMSVAELFSLRYGKDIGRIASMSLLLAMLGFSANYVKSLLLIFSPLSPETSPWLTSALLVLTILLLTLRGGLVAVISTDIISFIGTIIIIPLLFYFSYTTSGHNFSQLQTSFPLSESQKLLPSRLIVSFIVLTMFTYIAAPWYGQKIFAAASEKIAFTAVAFSAIIVFLLYAFPTLAVAFLKVQGIGLTSGEKGVPYILSNLLPQGLRGFSYALLFAAGATTLAGVWSAMTTMLVADFSRPAQVGSSYVRSLQITLVLAGATYVAANTLIDQILSKLILANIPIAALSFALLAGFYWKKASRAGAMASIVVGFSWGVFCYLYFGDKNGYTWYWAMYGIPLIFLSGIVTSYLFPMREKEKEMLQEFSQRMQQN